MKNLFLISNGIRFLMEPATLAIWLIFGSKISWLLAIAVLVLILIIWGLWVAPKSAKKLPIPARLLLEVLIFAGTFLLYWHFQASLLAVAYLVIALLTSVLSKIGDGRYS